MTDKMRWRYSDTNAVVAPVDAATVIEIGDLVWQDADDAKPVSRLPCNHHENEASQNWQHAFAHDFLGVAMQRSRSGETTPIRVATTGVFEFDCAPDTFELGDLIGPDENTAGNALLNQQVETVAESRYAIGRVAKRQASAATSVLVDIRSTVMTGGVEGSSPSGV
jgi:hypothetical protein